MIDFGEFDKMIKISEKWINQTLTTGLVVIFCSLFTVELFQTKYFFEFFYIFAIEEIDKKIENVKSYKRRVTS